MKDEELEIEEPTGKFILDNLPFEKRFQAANGMYVHYSDVCTLLKKYYESKVNKLNKADVISSFACFDDDNECTEQCGLCKHVANGLKQANGL